MAGAWRSLRYDMGRRPSEPPAGGPDVTSTGMNTFGGTQWDFARSRPRCRSPAGRPRRAGGPLLVSAFGLLTVLGAAGAYLVVVNGLVPLRGQTPAAAGTFRRPAGGDRRLRDRAGGARGTRPRRTRRPAAGPCPAAAPRRTGRSPTIRLRCRRRRCDTPVRFGR